MKELALQYIESVQPRFLSICEPLFSFGIQNFNFMRIYNDGRYISFINNLDYLKLYMDRVSNVGDYFTERLKLLSTQKTLYSFAPMNFTPVNIKNDLILDLLYNFDMGSGFYIYKLENTEYVECFCFLNSQKNMQFQQFCIDNLVFLERFCIYFKNNIEPTLIVKDFCQFSFFNQTFRFSSLETDEKYYERIKNFLSKTQLEKVALKGKNDYILLSKREAEYLYLLSIGKNNKEIANDMEISINTTEYYMNRIKDKTKFTSKSKILSAYNDCFHQYLNEKFIVHRVEKAIRISS